MKTPGGGQLRRAKIWVVSWRTATRYSDYTTKPQFGNMRPVRFGDFPTACGRKRLHEQSPTPPGGLPGGGRRPARM